MEAAWATTLILIVILVLICAWRILNWLWFKPKRLEKLLREQGFQGNPYRLLFGDSKDLLKTRKKALSKPMNLSDNIIPRVSSYTHHTVNTHGKNCFIWLGPTPRVTILDPGQIKDVLNNMSDFPKPDTNPLVKLLATGLADHDGEKWSKHRRLINPAFNLERLKVSCLHLIDIDF
ncbi:cytochrome P450 CYP72A219-like [Vigna radiata var. radiata]|uniref:Cytochrome P450 CYP72A219-like n=1 Tax=Vigna radiata var. radiata TaxID=3916 RepID=A0A3Q0EJ22_VIGRR|nr:cytochrome P450 CYP72A219-like [Vigna radiata var. radiata]XP_022631979.1 cytochrome P450 CYP72A219-like [Vigna radiata var. radiata]